MRPETVAGGARGGPSRYDSRVGRTRRRETAVPEKWPSGGLLALDRIRLIRPSRPSPHPRGLPETGQVSLTPPPPSSIVPRASGLAIGNSRRRPEEDGGSLDGDEAETPGRLDAPHAGDGLFACPQELSRDLQPSPPGQSPRDPPGPSPAGCPGRAGPALLAGRSGSGRAAGRSRGTQEAYRPGLRLRPLRRSAREGSGRGPMAAVVGRADGPDPDPSPSSRLSPDRPAGSNPLRGHGRPHDPQHHDR